MLATKATIYDLWIVASIQVNTDVPGCSHQPQFVPRPALDSRLADDRFLEALLKNQTAWFGRCASDAQMFAMAAERMGMIA